MHLILCQSAFRCCIFKKINDILKVFGSSRINWSMQRSRYYTCHIWFKKVPCMDGAYVTEIWIVFNGITIKHFLFREKVHWQPGTTHIYESYICNSKTKFVWIIYICIWWCIILVMLQKLAAVCIIILWLTYVFHTNEHNLSSPLQLSNLSLNFKYINIRLYIWAMQTCRDQRALKCKKWDAQYGLFFFRRIKRFKFCDKHYFHLKGDHLYNQCGLKTVKKSFYT